MKVTIKKTFVDENGFSILKGRVIDVDEKYASKLEAEGIIEASEKKSSKTK